MVKAYDDIKREREKENSKEMTNDIRENVSDLVGGIFNDFEDLVKRKKIERDLKEERRKKTLLERIQAIFIIIGLIGIAIFIINFLLGNIWLLRFFVKSLLGGF